jgi:hypothetical protein
MPATQTNAGKPPATLLTKLYLFWCGNWRHLQRVYPFLRGHSFLGVILGPLFVGGMIWDFASRRGA